MIKIKLQHFGASSSAPISTLEISPSPSATPSNNNQNNNSQYQSPRKRNDTESSANEIKKIILNSENIIEQPSFEPKRAVNLNRSKSANEVSILRNTSSNTDAVKINNLNLHTNNNLDESQKVWKRSILRKQSLKQKKILEWANKKPISIKQQIQDTARNSLFDNSLSKTTNDSSRSKKEEDNDDDLTTFAGDAAAAIVQKSDMERSLRKKLSDNELIDLSKARFKKLEMMDFQKRLFIERQLKKAKSLPGLLR